LEHTKKTRKMMRATTEAQVQVINNLLRQKFQGQVQTLRYAISNVLYDCHVKAGSLEQLCDNLALACQADRALRAEVMAMLFIGIEDLKFACELFEKMQAVAESLEDCSVDCLTRDRRVALFASHITKSSFTSQSVVQRFLSVHRQPETAMQPLVLNLSTREWAHGAIINEKEPQGLGYMGILARTMYDVALQRECLQNIVGLRLE